MKVLIDGVVYDSKDSPILLVFEGEEEQDVFGLERYVSAPDESTQEEREALMEMGIKPCPHKQTIFWTSDQYARYFKCVDCNKTIEQKWEDVE